MRITGGIHRGRPIASPSGLATRPTSDRARQAIFNILNHSTKFPSPPLPEAVVLDVFAGTGAMGLEALSHGAARTYFVEHNAAAARTCHNNIVSLGETARCQVLAWDALTPPERPAHLPPATLVFLDPPYGKNMGTQALTALTRAGWLSEGAAIVLEMSKKAPEETPKGLALLDERHYGIALVRFMARNQA